MKGVSVEETSARRYNYAIYFAHIVGYVGQTSEAHIERLKERNDQYDLNDKVGLLGIEKSMEQYLMQGSICVVSLMAIGKWVKPRVY